MGHHRAGRQRWAATRIEASLRIADGLLRVQAIALHGAGDLDPWMLLWWNRQTRLVRFGCTRSQDIWVHADIPVSDASTSAASTACSA